MKNYLSLNERNTWLSSMTLLMYNENMIRAWEKNLTKDELKKLKTSITMTKNALKSVSDRMPNNERKRIVKHSEDFEVRILNQTSAKVLQDRAIKDDELVEINRVKFEQAMDEFMKVKCANCNISCDGCIIYDFLVEAMMPRYELQNNCPYAYKTVVNKKSVSKTKSRKEKKTKNRYDDLEDEIEYNFKIKGR